MDSGDWCAHASVCLCVCVCVVCIYSYCLLGDNGRLHVIFKVLFVEMYANVVFVRSCLYSTASLTMVNEQCFIRIIYYYYQHTFSPSASGLREDCGDRSALCDGCCHGAGG